MPVHVHGGRFHVADPQTGCIKPLIWQILFYKIKLCVSESVQKLFSEMLWLYVVYDMIMKDSSFTMGRFWSRLNEDQPSFKFYWWLHNLEKVCM